MFLWFLVIGCILGNLKAPYILYVMLLIGYLWYLFTKK